MNSLKSKVSLLFSVPQPLLSSQCLTYNRFNSLTISTVHLLDAGSSSRHLGPFNGYNTHTNSCLCRIYIPSMGDKQQEETNKLNIQLLNEVREWMKGRLEDGYLTCLWPLSKLIMIIFSIINSHWRYNFQYMSVILSDYVSPVEKPIIESWALFCGKGDGRSEISWALNKVEPLESEDP